MATFQHELTKSMVQEYIDRGVELTPELIEGFAFRDRCLMENIEFMSPEHLKVHEEFVQAHPGVLEAMADIETDFILG